MFYKTDEFLPLKLRSKNYTTIYSRIYSVDCWKPGTPVTEREKASRVALTSSQDHLNQRKDKMQILDQKCCLLFERKKGRSK